MSLSIPFLDLSREITPIRDAIQAEFDRIAFKQTNFILGKELDEFERAFANYIGTEHCVGVANGTDAIEMAVNTLNLQSGDEIITQANTYVATCLGITNNNINGIRMKLVDCVPETYQMDLTELKKAITNKTKAVIIVHMTGACCDMDELMEIMNARPDIVLIEDCAQSHGAKFHGRRLGTFGKMATFSFYPGKNLGAFGDGGAICTNNSELDVLLRRMRSHGSVVKYQHEICGRNSRLDTLQAAILNIKLPRLDDNNAKRRVWADLYRRLLSDVAEIELPVIVQECEPVYHLFMIRVLSGKRDELRQYMKQHGIETGIHYPCSISQTECYRSNFKGGNVCAEENSRCILSLPMMPDLASEEIVHVCKTIVNFFATSSVDGDDGDNVDAANKK